MSVASPTVAARARGEATRRGLAAREQPPRPVEDEVEEEAAQGLRRVALHQALWTLPPEQRIAITLMDLAGFTASEAARITNAPRGTVLARVHRGRKRLARLLEKERVIDE